MRTNSGIVLSLVAALLLAGHVPPARAKTSDPELVWPAAPEPARVAFVKAFSRPDDLDIRRGIFQKLRNFIFGEEETSLVRPMAVVESGGVIFVADPGAHGVHRFDTKRGHYRLIQADDKAPLPSPVGLALGLNGSVYVSDSKLAQILVIEKDADVATPLAFTTDLLQPTGLAFDASSLQLYVVDTRAHQILVFNAQGNIVRTIGSRGTDPGQFNYPTMLWLSAEGQLFVTDSLNFRVQILDRQGQFISAFGQAGDGSGDAARQKGVATDSLGHVYVVDSLFHAVQIFERSGEYLLAVGSQGQGPGEFWLPVGIHIDASNTIYVTDTYNRRVQIFRYVGGDS